MFDEHFIPFRFQGQYDDEETDLYYNRFRYYDPELGQYITQDPIGLEGGNPTLYGYVHDPNNEIDPFGLDEFDFNSAREALRYAKELLGIPRSQQPISQWVVGNSPLRIPGANYVQSSNVTHHGRYFEFINAKGERVVTVLHTNDPRGLHAHAGVARGSDPRNYNFRTDRYRAINDPRTNDHHLNVRCPKRG